MRRLCPSSLVISLLASAVVTASPIDPHNPSPGRFLDEWAEIYLAGSKTGYMHSTMAREGDLIHTNTITKIEIGRVDSPIQIATVQRTTETLAGVPVSFGSEMNA